MTPKPRPDILPDLRRLWQLSCSSECVRKPTNLLQNLLLRKIAIGGMLLMPLMGTGCAVHAGYYDRAHSDYHRWGPNEREPYARWEAENHRSHTDYTKLNDQDRQAYWNWRHDHQ